MLIHDGSTLDALLRKVGLLREADTQPLAGRMSALLDLASRLPRQVWYEEDAQAHDQRCWPQLLAVLTAGSLVIFDLGYTNFMVFAQLAAAQVTWLTRPRATWPMKLNATCSAPRLCTSRWSGSGKALNAS